MAQAKKNDPVDVPAVKATALEAGEPVEHEALSQMGATFAERKAAREKAEKRAVSSRSAENKAVKQSDSK